MHAYKPVPEYSAHADGESRFAEQYLSLLGVRLPCQAACISKLLSVESTIFGFAPCVSSNKATDSFFWFDAALSAVSILEESMFTSALTFNNVKATSVSPAHEASINAVEPSICPNPWDHFWVAKFAQVCQCGGLLSCFTLYKRFVHKDWGLLCWCK